MFVTAAAAMLGAAAHAQTTYDWTTLPDNSGFPAALTNDGSILCDTVSSSSTPGVVLQRAQHVRPLSVSFPGHPELSVWGADFSQTQRLVGSGLDTDGVPKLAFLREPGGQVRTYSFAGFPRSVLSGINTRGVAVGGASDEFGTFSVPIVVFKQQQSIVQLPFAAGNGAFLDVNDRDEILGYAYDASVPLFQQFILTSAGFQRIAVPAGFDELNLNRLNNDGVCAGYCVTAGDGVAHGALRRADGSIDLVDWNTDWPPTITRDFGVGQPVTLHFDSPFSTKVFDINDRGEVLAESQGNYVGILGGAPVNAVVLRYGTGTPAHRTPESAAPIGR
jgi:hypothetical protein